MARAFGVSAGLPASDSASSNGDAQPQGAHGPQPQRVLQHKRDRVVGWGWFGPAPYRTPECLGRLQRLPWTRIGQIITSAPESNLSPALIASHLCHASISDRTTGPSTPWLRSRYWQ